MLKQYQCNKCHKKFETDAPITFNGEKICYGCWCNTNNIPKVDTPVFNEPEHYHKHGIDTIQFLQKGFPPEVFAHFCQANIIKYTQRANYKNGREDIVKVIDYAKRWLEWHDKTHS